MSWRSLITDFIAATFLMTTGFFLGYAEGLDKCNDKPDHSTPTQENYRG